MQRHLSRLSPGRSRTVRTYAHAQFSPLPSLCACADDLSSRGTRSRSSFGEQDLTNHFRRLTNRQHLVQHSHRAWGAFILAYIYPQSHARRRNARSDGTFLCFSHDNHDGGSSLDRWFTYSRTLSYYCHCIGYECAAYPDAGEGFIRLQWTTQHERAGARAAVGSMEILAQEIVRDARGRTGAIRDLAGEPGVHRLPQQLRRQAGIHTAHEPIRRSGETRVKSRKNVQSVLCM